MSNTNHDAIAVLVSGGLDSAVLLGEALGQYAAVIPMTIRVGSLWESVERAYLKRFMEAMPHPRLRPWVTLDQPVADLYGSHWSMTGDHVPDAASPDEAVFLPGRNVLLLAKALLWCHLNRVPNLALAPLAANPFPDATPAFFAAIQAVVNQAVDGNVQVLYPYLHLTKPEVIKRGRAMPLQHTFSCLQPIEGQHCGVCNKCAERHRAFVEAQVPDPTDYHSLRGFE